MALSMRPPLIQPDRRSCSRSRSSTNVRAGAISAMNDSGVISTERSCTPISGWSYSMRNEMRKPWYGTADSSTPSSAQRTGLLTLMWRVG